MYFGMPADTSKKSTETFFSNFNMTTAGNAGDVNGCIRIEGDVDGLWFSDAHWFGGKTGGVIISGDSVTEISGLTFDHCWFDQFTARNLIIQGDTSSHYRLITFDGCRFWGGTTGNIAIDTASGVTSVNFLGCEIGQTNGNGAQIGAGNVKFMNCTFAGINQDAGANGYAIQVPSGSAAGTKLTVKGCDFDLAALTFGIQLVDTAPEYQLHGCIFQNSGASLTHEIYFAGTALVGSCGGHQVDRTDAGAITASATVTMSNIATDHLTLEGTATTIEKIYPYWHGRTVYLYAETANMTMSETTGAGSIRNIADEASRVITGGDVAVYHYRGDSFRWHEIGGTTAPA